MLCHVVIPARADARELTVELTASHVHIEAFDQRGNRCGRWSFDTAAVVQRCTLCGLPTYVARGIVYHNATVDGFLRACSAADVPFSHKAEMGTVPEAVEPRL